MTKEEILSKLDKAVMQEEEAVPIYAEHISTTAMWAGLSNADIEKIKDYLRVLHEESIGHAKAFEKIKELI